MYTKAQVLKFLEKIELDGFDWLYLVGAILVFIGVVLKYGLPYALMFLGGALMAVPIMNLLTNRGQ